MKKITLLALTAFMMVGCEYRTPDGSYNTSKSFSLNTIVIDSCEYIIGHDKLAHKGNCKFCAKRHKKELDSLAIKIWEGFE